MVAWLCGCTFHLFIVKLEGLHHCDSQVTHPQPPFGFQVGTGQEQLCSSMASGWGGEGPFKGCGGWMRLHLLFPATLLTLTSTMEQLEGSGAALQAELHSAAAGRPLTGRREAKGKTLVLGQWWHGSVVAHSIYSL